MHAAEIEVKEIQGSLMGLVLKFLAESVGEGVFRRIPILMERLLRSAPCVFRRQHSAGCVNGVAFDQRAYDSALFICGANGS